MISVDINTAFADGLLRDLDRALTDMSPVYDEIGELLLGSTKERFREGVSPEGIAWPQKQMSTILATARQSHPVGRYSCTALHRTLPRGRNRHSRDTDGMAATGGR
jgi:hypothetical protein